VSKFGHHAPPCQHGDLVGILSGDFNSEQPFLDMVAEIDKLKFKTHVHCYTHGRKCRIFGPSHEDSDFDLSGLPCTNQSPVGAQTFEEGDTAAVFVAHAKYHIQKETAVLMIENVSDSRGLII
jgi:site-specific DNA-cytosine methylase